MEIRKGLRTGDLTASKVNSQRQAHAEVRFHAIFPVLTMLLQREGQVTYRILMQGFGLDEALLNDLREELTFRSLAIDKDGKGMVWREATHITMTTGLTWTLQEIRITDDPNAVVFRTSEGKPYRDISTAFSTAVRRARIIDFTFHDLRHTFASRLVMRGVDLTTVKELMGHKHINMTLRYAHLAPGHKRSAIAVLDPTEEKVATIFATAGKDAPRALPLSH